MIPHCNCPACQKERRCWARWGRWLAGTAFALLVLGILWMSFGCTVTPAIVQADQPSFSGNDANSGFLGWDKDTGAGIISSQAHDRYVALVKTYGGAFTPHLSETAGLAVRSDGSWLIDKQRLADFGVMAALNRSGTPPQPP